MTILLLATLGGASWPLIFLIIALVCLFIAAFVQPNPAGPWYARLSWGWAGMFFALLSLALS